MATSGIAWNPPKETIITVLKECKGVLTHAAKKFDVTPLTLRRKVQQDDELVELLKNLREDYETVMLDMAENCVAFAMSQQTKRPEQALKASFFVLNSKGKTRGWSNTFTDNQVYSPQLSNENEKMELDGLRQLAKHQQKVIDDLRNQS